MKAAFAMETGLQYKLFDQPMLHRLETLASISTDVAWTDFDGVSQHDLAETEVLVTGWFAPRVGPEVVERMPALRAILHAGGSVKSIVSDAVWDRGILVTTAADANAVPVAEYTLAMIIAAGKRVFPLSREYSRRQTGIDLTHEYPAIGAHRATVGIIGASRIGRKVIELLRPFAFEVLVSDPFLSDAEANELGVESVALPELLSRSTIVSLHAPDLDSTRGMIGAAEFALMADGATFINTARQALVDQDALIDELRTGRIDAVLDVTDPDPLYPGHPLFGLTNVLLTPHIAGSRGTELLLLGESVLGELERLAAGAPPLHPVHATSLATMA